MATHQPVLKLGPEDRGREVSSEEFASAEFAEPWVYEREDGRLVVMSPEGQRHHDHSRPWRIRLHRYWLEHPEVVEDVIVGAWVRPDGDTDRIGDIGVYLLAEGPRPPIPDRVPDVMFEIVSPGRESRERDYVEKRASYSKLGIREYVVSDAFAKSVTVFARGRGGYRKTVLAAADTYTSPLLPGLEIPLSEVL